MISMEPGAKPQDTTALSSEAKRTLVRTDSAMWWVPGRLVGGSHKALAPACARTVALLSFRIFLAK